MSMEEMMKIPGLGLALEPDNLVAKAYGEICKGLIDVSDMISTDVEQQFILRV